MKLQKHSWIFAVNFIAVATCLIFSLEFYAQISLFFCAFVVILEITKSLFTRYILDKSIGLPLRILALIICIIATVFSVFGSIANGFNFISSNISSQYKSVENQEFLQLQEDIKLATKDLDYYKNELQKMPSVEVYVGNIPSWQPQTREKLTLKYSEEKAKKEEKIVESQNKLDSLKAKKINSKVKVKVKESGYSNILQQVSDLTEWKIETIILIITIALSLGLELVIITSSLICKKSILIDSKNALNWEKNNLEELRNGQPNGQEKPRKRYILKKPTLGCLSNHRQPQPVIISDSTTKIIDLVKKENKIQPQTTTTSDTIDLVEYKKNKATTDNHRLIGKTTKQPNRNIDNEWLNKLFEKYGESIPNRDEIAKDFNISVHQSRKILSQLKDKCLIKRTKEGIKICEEVLENV